MKIDDGGGRALGKQFIISLGSWFLLYFRQQARNLISLEEHEEYQRQTKVINQKV